MKQVGRGVIRGTRLMMALFVTSLLLNTGCEGDSGGGGGGGDLVGTWALYSGDTIQGSPFWYLQLQDDETFFISNEAGGAGVRVSGTYSESDGRIVGPFVNPGVGEGRIEATVDDGVMQLDFIEYWHTPNKVVPYAGTKL